MLKRTIKYENLDGEMVEKEFYFSLSKSELIKIEMENANGGGFEESMRRIIESNDGKAIMEEFEKIILATVGYRDGDEFIKTEEYTRRFKGSGAYDELFVELVTDAEKGAEFINSVVPRNLAEKIRNMNGRPQDHLQKEENDNLLVMEKKENPVPDAESLYTEKELTAMEDRIYTKEELMSMSPEEFSKLRNQMN